MSHKVRKDAVSTANKKLDSRLRRLLREAKRNPVAEEMNKVNKPKTFKQKKRAFKDKAFDDLDTWHHVSDEGDVE